MAQIRDLGVGEKGQTGGWGVCFLPSHGPRPVSSRALKKNGNSNRQSLDCTRKLIWKGNARLFRDSMESNSRGGREPKVATV